MKLWQQILLIILATTAIGTWSLVFEGQKDGLLHIYALDVGQGDAIFIEAPNGNQVLVDGGPGNKILSSLDKVMSRADTTIDVVVLTHPDSDHIAGLLPVFEKYNIGQVVEGGGISDSDVYKKFVLARDAEVEHSAVVKAGDRIMLSEEAGIDIFAPENTIATGGSNDATIIGKLFYRDVSLLLTGDVEKRGEARLLQSDLPLEASVLKVPHHGSRFSSNAAFLAAVKPVFSLLSVGRNNYGHPTPEALDRIDDTRSIIYRTDTLGTVHLLSDGSNFWVERE